MTPPEENRSHHAASARFQGVRKGTSHGLGAYLIETPHSKAAISAFGGQLLSFVPTGSVHDMLWVSPLLAAPPTPIRGGIPVCWPYFAREGQPEDAPSHGYARTARWALTTTRTASSGAVELELEPEGLDHLDVRLQMTVRVGTHLEQGLHTHNPGVAPVRLTEALHNYFRVSDATVVRVEGLAGLTYVDKFDQLRTFTQHGDWTLPADRPRSDRVYPDAGGTYRLVDPGFGRAIEIRGHAARTAVVWNPGVDVANGMADIGPHWREFACVETANVGDDAVHVAAGTTHSMWQTISVSPLDT
ncbi:D-hexose-6-phosphate mutarotase [Gordonia sp. DT219]|uniref:D-hexose-6-phosphate mutarotase n=1 Tax=Gordonia sp. DT219 TaxID=3416658 RepID=UPI003CEE37DB